METILTVLSSLGVSAAGAWVVAQILMNHYLKRDEEKLKGEIRKEVDDYLEERKAERDYVFAAKKRLYTEIGPLRFQLLLASREFVGRLLTHAHQEYATDLNGYYGKTTLYRLLRPLAITDLIQRRVTVADFSVDPSAVALLRFANAWRSALSDSDAILHHPKADWSFQKQHIFRGNIDLAASVLLQDSNDDITVIDYEGFEERLSNLEYTKKLAGIPRISSEFSITNLPILWARLVCYGFICNRYISEFGKGIGFSEQSYDPVALIVLTGDPYFEERQKGFAEACLKVATAPL